MIRNYIKMMFRNLRKNKTYSFLNIFGLAIGIASAGLCFLWVEDELTFDNIHEKKTQLYRVNINLDKQGQYRTMASTPRPMAAAITASIPGVANATRISDMPRKALFSIGNKALYSEGRYVDSQAFSMFTFSFIQGDSENPFPELYSLVITETAAKKFFGKGMNVIGRTIRVDKEQDFVVSGVVKDPPQNSFLQFEWLAPFKVSMLRNLIAFGSNDDNNWGSYGPYTFVELSPGAQPEKINLLIKGIVTRNKSDEKSEAFLFPLSDIHLYNDFEKGKPTGGGRITQVRMISTIAWVILLVACINFMNLATANSQRRAREVGVRKVLGAGKNKLVFQFMTEALFISLLSALVAVGIMAASLPSFNVIMQKELSLRMYNPLHILSILSIALICGLISGSYPALYLSSFKPVTVLKALSIKTGGAALVRKGLVVLQFTVSLVFIISTVIIYQQIEFAKNRQLGFVKDGLIEVDLQHDGNSVFPVMKQELLKTGLFQNLGLSDHPTIRGGNTKNRFSWQGKPDGLTVSIALRHVNAGFLSTSGMKIIEGRDFREEEASDNNVIINESFAKMLGEGPATGKIIQEPTGADQATFTSLTVVGVVGDYAYGNMYERSGPVVLMSRPSKSSNLVYARLRKNADASEAISKLDAVMKKYNPGYPLAFKFMDDQFDSLFLNETLLSKIAGTFAVLAIIISCLGLFGLAAYSAARRTREISIRKVLGANLAGLMKLLSKEFLQPVIISCLVAFPLAWWIMNEWLNDYQLKTSINWWVFAIAGLAVVIIALATVSVQTIRAVRSSPVASLKSE